MKIDNLSSVKEAAYQIIGNKSKLDDVQKSANWILVQIDTYWKNEKSESRADFYRLLQKNINDIVNIMNYNQEFANALLNYVSEYKNIEKELGW